MGIFHHYGSGKCEPKLWHPSKNTCSQKFGFDLSANAMQKYFGQLLLLHLTLKVTYLTSLTLSQVLSKMKIRLYRLDPPMLRACPCQQQVHFFIVRWSLFPIGFRVNFQVALRSSRLKVRLINFPKTFYSQNVAKEGLNVT